MTSWLAGLYVGVAVLSWLLTSITRLLAARWGFLDRPGTESYKWHTEPMPYLGGLPLILSTAVAATVGSVGMGIPIRPSVAVLVGATLCGAVGAWDDRRPLGPLAKTLPIALGALLLTSVGLRFNLTGVALLDSLATICWVVGVVHAFNVIDNMNGVAVGLAIISCAGFVALPTHNYAWSLIAASVAGSSLGFVPHNYPRATIFLGDSGTLSLGFFLAALGLGVLVPPGNLGGVSHVLVASVVLGVPLLNAFLVSFSRLKSGRRITHGGLDSAAHRLLVLGFSQMVATLILWGVGVAVAITALVISKMPPSSTLAVAVLATLGTIVLVWRVEKVPYGPEALKLESAEPSQAA